MKSFFIYIGIVVALSGCKKIENTDSETSPEEQQVTLRLMMPQIDQAGTYAISGVDQNTIHTLDVLAFRVADDGKEIYAYRKRGVLLRPNPDGAEVNFYANLLKSEDKYRFVLIANAATQLQTALSKLPVNAEKETVMSSITYSIMTRWNASSPANFTALPMWGESSIIPKISNTTAGFSVAMLRSLASIDVKVLADNFTMTAVYVYNSSKHGRVAPTANNYNAIDCKVTAASIPDTRELLSPQEYLLPVDSTASLLNEIFLFESNAAESIGESTATGLVIAGKYAGSTITTYYRIDLTDSTGQPSPILRNHRYRIRINNVFGPGFNDKDLAWKSRTANMTATIASWDEVTLSGTTVSPQYYLEVSDDERILGGFQYQFQFTVSTNIPGGHRLVNFPPPTSLQILSKDVFVRGEGDSTTIYTFEVSKNTTGTNIIRTLSFSVKTNKLEKNIIMRQQGRPVVVDNTWNFVVHPNNIVGLSRVESWFRLANIEVGNFDPNAPQKSGTPYPESCAALGPDYRLPTYSELDILVPEDPGKRTFIYNALTQGQGSPMFTGYAGSSLYVSSSSVSNNNRNYRRKGVNNPPGVIISPSDGYPLSEYLPGSPKLSSPATTVVLRCVMDRAKYNQK
ncbi:Uncharacterised protein [Sphingobacterium spiritivorum]|uniref:Major fimbrial subunit protein (FimA) n=1 Tax=Sphingobacterium spiritivorum TaxID=258 RepID=A0A380BUV4_SPHSI|nr:hypothetical protein [Sphingobacterium spiritivorum]SUJ06365.1 Uncharacterised protein [Sphingobacterium spiritivorum]